MLQRITFGAFVAFWACAATVVALWALVPAGDAAEPGERTIDAAELGRHDDIDDCWLAIEGVVYDISDYVPQHPAPPAVLGTWCGKEATEGMRTKGYGRDHSPMAWEMLERYRIGVYQPADEAEIR